MARDGVVNIEFIKRGGTLAASFLIATVALVIAQAQPANALLGGLLGDSEKPATQQQTPEQQPTQKNGLLAPLNKIVNGLLDRDTGLVPATTDTVTGLTGKFLPRTTDTLNKTIITPVTDRVLPDAEKAVNELTEAVDKTTDPVTQPVSNMVPNLTRPVDTIVSRLSDALRNGVGAPTNPNKPLPTNPGHDNDSANKAVTPSDSSSAVAGTKDSKLKQIDSKPFLASVGSFFTSTLPDTLQSIASSIVGKQVGMLPIAISILLFLVMLGAIVVIVHASNHGGVLALGSLGTINLSRFMRGHDLAQIASFAIVITGLGVISIYLTLTVL